MIPNIENTLIVVSGIVCITFLEILALLHGINGLALSLTVGAISGIAVASIQRKKRKG
ncbi:hypothetical protein ES702_07403 [subsurface metagenome]